MKHIAACFLISIASITAYGADPSGLGTLDFRQVVTRAKDRVFPSLVFLKCLQESHETGKKQAHEIAGSGVLISSGGELLTNWHVVDKAIQVRCLLFDGRNFDAEVVGSDKDLDLALVRLKAPKGAKPFPCAEIGESSLLKEGDFVMAMGAPWGLTRSVSIGIISCTRRYLESNSDYSLWLQTDASISPGNSGGPLVNTAGQVIGINTLGTFFGGDMGFSVPSSTIREILPRLRQYGDVKWSWTGLRLQPIRDFDRNVYFEGTEGAIVASTDEASPARQSGIRDLDRILSINGKKVTALTSEELPAIRRMIALLPVDSPAIMVLVRDSTRQTVRLTPRIKGRVEGKELDCPRWDLTVKAINQFDNPNLYFYCKEGVFIYGIRYPGNAASSELRREDIILSINEEPVKTLDDVRRIWQRSKDGIDSTTRLTFKVLRGGLMNQIILDYARDYERE